VLPLKDNVPTRSFPIVTVALIAVNVVAWLWEVRTGFDREVLRYGYYPCAVHGPCVAPASEFDRVAWYEGVFTSMFLHAGWVHIGGNMLFLWIFGNNVEDAMGRVRFVLFYFLAGLAAAALQSFVTLAFSSAAGASVPNVGASGAIAGVLGAYFVLLPRARVLTAVFVILIFFVNLPAYVFLGVWFAFQLWDGGFALLHPQAGGGVAFFAHVGGFVLGLLTASAFAVRKPLEPVYR
jgi:membrane associated rhomboid family serine protease